MSSPSDLFLAMLMLAAPVGTPEQTPKPNARFAEVAAALREVAIQEEWLGEGQKTNVFSYKEIFQRDLDEIRSHRDLLKDAPKVVESKRFPQNIEFYKPILTFNRAYRANLVKRLFGEQDRANLIMQAIKETDKYYEIWTFIMYSRDESYNIVSRRYYLKKARDLIGEDDYNNNVPPPIVPDWAFTPLPR
jgi:hypothetical protein